MLLKWIICGPNLEVKGENRQKEINQSTSVISQVNVRSTKTSRQRTYVPKENEKGLYITIGMPLTMGLDLYIHQKTRNKEFVQTLHNLGLIIKDNIANAVKS